MRGNAWNCVCRIVTISLLVSLFFTDVCARSLGRSAKINLLLAAHTKKQREKSRLSKETVAFERHQVPDASEAMFFRFQSSRAFDSASTTKGETKTSKVKKRPPMKTPPCCKYCPQAFETGTNVPNFEPSNFNSYNLNSELLQSPLDANAVPGSTSNMLATPFAMLETSASRPLDNGGRQFPMSVAEDRSLPPPPPKSAPAERAPLPPEPTTTTTTTAASKTGGGGKGGDSKAPDNKAGDSKAPDNKAPKSDSKSDGKGTTTTATANKPYDKNNVVGKCVSETPTTIEEMRAIADAIPCCPVCTEQFQPPVKAAFFSFLEEGQRKKGQEEQTAPAFLEFRAGLGLNTFTPKQPPKDNRDCCLVCDTDDEAQFPATMGSEPLRPGSSGKAKTKAKKAPSGPLKPILKNGCCNQCPASILEPALVRYTEPDGGPFGIESRLEGLNYELRGSNPTVCPEGQHFESFHKPT